MRTNKAMSGKRFVWLIVAALVVLTVMYIGGSATFVQSKAIVCNGYPSVEDQQNCFATATAGPPPKRFRYH